MWVHIMSSRKLWTIWIGHILQQSQTYNLYIKETTISSDRLKMLASGGCFLLRIMILHIQETCDSNFIRRLFLQFNMKTISQRTTNLESMEIYHIFYIDTNVLCTLFPLTMVLSHWVFLIRILTRQIIAQKDVVLFFLHGDFFSNGFFLSKVLMCYE
jgi:hypothetical protein